MRFRAAVAGVVVVAAVAAGVTAAVVVLGDHGHLVQAPVDGRRGGSVEMGGARLSIPPGAVSGSGHLTASTVGEPPVNGPASGFALADASSPVHFEVTGAKVTGELEITFRVGAVGLPQGLPSADTASAVWLAYYDPAAGQWQPVASRYDRAAGTVTAEVRHLSWWAPWTWDWQGFALRLRQSLSGLGTGRAPAVTCPGVPKVTVASEGMQDPPLIGCAAKRGTDTLSVSITNNRGLSMVMSAVPPDATQDPPDYQGFDGYIATRDATTHMLGGTDLPASQALTYSLPLHGPTAVFTAAPTVPSYALDLASIVGEDLVGAARYGELSGEYATCILNTVGGSEPASFADAPRVAVKCLPALGKAVPALKGLASPAVKLIELDATSILQDYDLVHDAIRGVTGQVTIVRPGGPVLGPIDWNNRQYALTCDNIVQTPVNVAFSGDNATARGPGIGPYDKWDMSIDQVTHGILPSLGNVTAVLFGCSPQPSNFSVPELRIYRTADGSEVGRIPELPANGGVLPGVYKAGSITILNGHVAADVMFYGPGDSHASGPSVPGQLSWSWNGQQFITDASPGTACPDSAQLLSAWNAAPAAIRQSWVAPQVTGFAYISCWHSWVVAEPTAVSPGNGAVVFSQMGSLHLITVTELQQQFRNAVCSAPDAPPGWRNPPLISCN